MHGTVGTIINCPKHQQCLALMVQRLNKHRPNGSMEFFLSSICKNRI